MLGCCGLSAHQAFRGGGDGGKGGLPKPIFVHFTEAERPNNHGFGKNDQLVLGWEVFGVVALCVQKFLSREFFVFSRQAWGVVGVPSTAVLCCRFFFVEKEVLAKESRLQGVGCFRRELSFR